MSDWISRLRPASFRGVPFAVEGGDRIIGRRQAPHEYPDRDDAYVEDMGRRLRRIAIRGFLVDNSAVYGGGDVLAQCARLEAAAEAYGPGILVHPTKGRLSVSLETLKISESRDRGGAFDLQFEFIQAGTLLFGTSILSTINAVLGVADAVLGVIGGAFGAGITGASGPGLNAAGAAAASELSSQTVAYATDAGSAFNLSTSLVSSAADTRVALTAAGSDLVLSASQIDTSDSSFDAVSSGISSLINGATSISSDPADNMRIATQLYMGGE